MVLGIDHIAISAGRLQEGVEYVEAALGVPLEAGGRHLMRFFKSCLVYNRFWIEKSKVRFITFNNPPSVFESHSSSGQCGHFMKSFF